MIDPYYAYTGYPYAMYGAAAGYGYIPQQQQQQQNTMDVTNQFISSIYPSQQILIPPPLHNDES